MKVWAIIENTTYGDRLIGVCSSEEKAKLAIEISNRVFDFVDFGIEELELDEYLNRNRDRLEDEISELKKAENLLKRIKELDP